MGSRGSCHEEKLTSYYRVVNYLLNTYTTDDKVSQADADISNYKHLQGLNAVDYSLSEKSPTLWTVYDEYQLKGNFIEEIC